MAQTGVPDRLTALFSSWGADDGTVTSAATDVATRYDEPHRRYHNREHIDEVLAVTDRLHAPDAVTLAVWFHDAVYEPANGDNEARSGAHARVILSALGAPAALIDEVERLVHLTAHHAPAPDDAHGCALSDADLSILGAPTERYERYRRDVRAEYAHLDDDAWRAGRRAVIESFLARDRLFHDAGLRAELGGRARDNLERELVALSSP